MRPVVPLRAAFDDEHLLAPVMSGATREPMRAILLAAMGEPLTDSELDKFRRLTGRPGPPKERIEELSIIAGRRSGKSSGVASLAVYLAALCDFSDRLSPGERGVVLLVAENQKQANVLLGYIDGALNASPALAKLIVNRTRTTLELSNAITIEVRSADFRGLRGVTLIAALCDEIAFWRSDDAANPDMEIIAAIKPALVTTGGPLISIGSPYARRGYQFNLFKRHFGPAGDAHILIAKGATRDFNATIPQNFIDREVEADPASARGEWLAEWRSDIESFVSREAVEACIYEGRFELPFEHTHAYFGFVDPSGGSGDDMTLAIAHGEGERVVLDCVRSVTPPFSPDAVVKEFAETLRSYNVGFVTGDRYGGEWPRERFRQHGVQYECSEQSKSELYRALLPLINAGRVELLDHPKLITQLSSLERRTGRGTGRDVVDHPAGAHDDIANAVAGALLLARRDTSIGEQWVRMGRGIQELMVSLYLR